MACGFSAPLLFLLLATITTALNRTSPCYTPNGGLAEGNFPCFLSQTHSACCGGGSICEASGLCKVDGSVGVSELIRGACTDPTWKDQGCQNINLCIGAGIGGTNLISCQNITNSELDFCCDHTNGCCDSGIGRFQVQGNIDVITLGTAGATFKTAGIIGSTSSSSLTSAPSLGSSSSSSSSTSAPSLGSSSSSSSSTSAPSLGSTSSSSSTSATSRSSTKGPTKTGTGGSQTSSSTSTLPVGNASKGGISIGAKAGIGIACAVVGLAIIGGIVYFVLREKEGSEQRATL